MTETSTQETLKNLSGMAIRNPFIRIITYLLFAMTAGIGIVWVLLGIISPVLFVLLIMKW